MMMLIETTFEIGQTVYLKTDKEQCPRIVTSIKIFTNNSIAYFLSCGLIDSSHYDIEMTAEKDVTLANS